MTRTIEIKGEKCAKCARAAILTNGNTERARQWVVFTFEKLRISVGGQEVMLNSMGETVFSLNFKIKLFKC